MPIKFKNALSGHSFVRWRLTYKDAAIVSCELCNIFKVLFSAVNLQLVVAVLISLKIVEKAKQEASQEVAY